VKKFKRLDIMVNNAGIGTLGSILDTNDKIWQDTIGVNLSGVFYGTRAASIAMRDLKINGAIINMTSILGTVGFPGAVSYCSAKGGVTNLTRASAIDLAPLGIRVNAIAPAFIKTKMTEGVLTDKNFKKMISDNTPLGYVGEPEDIAKAALFLATEDSSYVTGETLHVDGGWTAR
jgi:NAD(P)-dependent dehydrogenase (short-subunit alcohol dehydrogenase family)